MKPSPRLHRVVALAAVMLAFASSCGDSEESTTTIDLPTTSPTVAPEILLLPEFVRGVIPGAQLLLLVTPADPAAGPIVITAEAPGAEVTVEPAEISGTQIAEVTIVPLEAASDSVLTATITASAGGQSRSVTREMNVLPWDDDRGEQGAQILGLFTPWLAENHAELGITPDTVFSGTHVAPELLVVSHYLFLNEEWEAGVSWHIMIPPDDFAELYLRPRDEMRPTRAFRIGSWQTALETGEYEVEEVTPPADVVR